MKKTVSILILLFIVIGCSSSQSEIEAKKKKKFPNLPIQLPFNYISKEECISRGGDVFNTLGKTTYKGHLIGTIKGMRCPCACLVSDIKYNTLWITINGKREKFKGNVKSIKTFDDCKKAGFKILTKKYEQMCMVGEPYMTNGNYKTFENNPMEEGKKCSDYRYSSCPSSCVPKCTSSGCSDTPYGRACTSDCEGVGGCMERGEE